MAEQDAPRADSFDAAFPDAAPAADFESAFPDRPETQASSAPGLFTGLSAKSPEDWDDYLKNTPTGRVMGAFGHAWEGPGLTEAASAALRKANWWNDYTKQQKDTGQAWGEAFMRPAANSLRGAFEVVLKPVIGAVDVVARAAHGVMGMVEQAGAEAERTPLGAAFGAERLGRDLAGMLELEMTRGEIMPRSGATSQAAAFRGALRGSQEPAAAGLPRERIEPTIGAPGSAAEFQAITEGADGVPAAVRGGEPDLVPAEFRPLPEPVARARADAVIGEGEEGYFGTSAVTPEQEAARAAAARELPPEVSPETAAGVSAKTRDQVAREVAPDVFAKLDALEARKATFRQWLDDLDEARHEARPVTDLDKRIAELERKSANAGARNRKRYDEELETLRGQRQAEQGGDTPDMATVRRAMVETDYELRDLLPDVSEAYRRADERMPAVEGGAEAPAVADAAPGAEPHPAPETLLEAEPRTGPALGEQASIADEVAGQLQAAGRSVEEARAAAAIVEAYYKTRAERFGGKLGTAEDLYRGTAPKLGQTAKRAPADRELELAQGPSEPAPVFYSALTKAIETHKQPKAPAGDWAAIVDKLPGVTKEEVEWSGVKDWLALQDGPVSRESLVSFLENNGLKLEEVTKGGDLNPDGSPPGIDYNELERLRTDLHRHGYSIEQNPDDPYQVAFRESEDPDADFMTWDEIPEDSLARGVAEQVQAMYDRAEQMGAGPDGGVAGGARYQSWQLPGGTNYREMLITLPSKAFGEMDVMKFHDLSRATWEQMSRSEQMDYIDQYRRQNGGEYALHSDDFRSGHWSEPNILTHVRFNDRVGPNGEKILHLEEIQSDWHQRGRKVGYKPTEAEHAKVTADLSAARAELVEAMKAEGIEDTNLMHWADNQLQQVAENVSAMKAPVAKYLEANKALDDLGRGNVPNAPFKKTWHELAFKRMLRYAAENGYDEVTWTTGAQQAERYDLSREINKIEVKTYANQPRRVSLDLKNTGVVTLEVDEVGKITSAIGRAMNIVHELDGKNLEDVIGKALTEKILAAKHLDTFEGEGLKVGGSGMKGFYDRILPQYAAKVGKKYGAKVGDREIKTDFSGPDAQFDRDVAEQRGDGPPTSTVHSMTLPDSLKDAVLQGQPLFQRGGKGGSVSGVWGNGERAIKLLKDADASTFMHESSHAWLEDLVRDSQHPDAPADLRADAQKVLEWLGVKDPKELYAKGDNGRFTKQARAANEKWARGFERYLMEGRAPSKALADAFEKFRQWLVDIYQTVTKLRAPINDDIRDVFDRMLAIKPEKVTISEGSSRRGGIGDIHEADAAAAADGDLAGLGDRMHGERVASARQIGPNLERKLNAGAEAETGRAPREGADGGGDAAGPLGGDAGARAAAGEVGPGGSRGVAAPPEPPKPEHLYLKPGKEPKRLASFVKARGGLSEQYRGEVQSFADKKGAKGLINARNGQSADDMALWAWEQGYFPDFPERPSVDDLLRALEDDVRGNVARYSEHDAQEVARYTDAIHHNAEVDQLANQYGIDTSKVHLTQFWEMVRERKSIEELDADISSKMEAEAAAWREAEALDRAEGGDPDAGFRANRTLEDLERERRAEESARAAGEGPQPAQRPGPVAGDAGGVPEGGGPDLFDPRFAGRQGEQIGPLDSGPPVTGEPAGAGGGKRGPEQRASASEPFRDPEPELIDKAGNIRLENLNTPEDVNAYIRQTAVENADFVEARRGVMTVQQQIELADAMGVEPSFIDTRKVGQAYNAEQIIAGRKALVHAATEVRNRAFAAVRGGEAELAAYAEARARLRMVQETVAQQTAEAGRALGAFRALSKMEGAAETKALDEFFQSATGRTPAELLREAQMVMDLETPSQVARSINDAFKPTWLEKVIEFRQAAMLWGPITFVRNLLGNTMVVFGLVPEHAATIALSQARRAVTGEGPVAHWGEVMPAVYGMVKGAQQGLRVAKMILKDEEFLNRARLDHHEYGFTVGFGELADKPRKGPALEGKFGKVARLSFRALSAADAVFKGILYQQRLAMLAYREAFDAGLVGEEFVSRVTQLQTNPHPNLMKAASDFADYGTFQKRLHGFGQTLQMVANKHPQLKVIFPFIKTPLNILSFASERSILAPFVKDARENLMGRNGKMARDEQIARMAIGSSVSIAALSWALEGNITGGGPENPAERARLQLSGWKPYAFQVPGGTHYISYQGLEPFATLMGVAADAHEISSVWTEKEAGDLAMLMFASVNQNFLNKNYMQGLSDFGEILSKPKQYAEQYFNKLVGSFIPNISAQAARATDPYMREARGLIDSIKQRTPGWSRTLYPKRDIWGEPLKQGVGDGLGDAVDIVNPFYVSKITNDPVNKALDAVNLSPTKPERKIRGVELTPAQYDKFVTTAGRGAKQQLDQMVRDPRWGTLPGQVRYEMMQQTISAWRDMARNRIMAESVGTSNDIMAKAQKIKADLAKKRDR